MSLMTEYYNWLCERMSINPRENGIESVCSMLMVSPFVAVLKDDENLIESALYLRRTFVRGCDQEQKREFYHSLKDCSVLEIMSVLLEKMSYMLLENPLASSDQGALFFELLDNLELGWINDRSFSANPDVCSEYIEDAVSIFVNRDYDDDGQNGGMFPLENPRSDAREMGLYQQMDEYLIERYDMLN